MSDDLFKGMKPAEKAYTLNWHYVEEDYLYDKSQYIVYAENRNKAKAELLKMAQEMEVSFIHTCQPTFINLRIRRDHNHDRYLIDGTLYTEEIYRIHLFRENQKQRIDDILANDEITHCFIIKNGSYYRDNCCGYTSKMEEAGVYEKAVAAHHCRGYVEMQCQPINIKEYNDMINSKIEYLKTRLL